MRRDIKELVAGGFGGTLQCIVGHPFDLMKVRLQSQSQLGTNYTNMFDMIKVTARHEGFRGFFAGMSLPFYCSGGLNAALFSINGTMKRLVCKQIGADKVSDLKLKHIIFSALLTAPIYALFVAPIELVKNRLQIQSYSLKKVYNGPADCIFRTVRYGGLTALFAGYSATVIMRTLGLPAYLSTFNVTKRHLIEEHEMSSQTSALIGGCTAGASFWLVCFPADSIKTVMQNHGAALLHNKKKEKTCGIPQQKFNILTAIKEIYVNKNTYGRASIRNFYRGLQPCLIRSIPANGVVFLGVDLALQMLGDDEGFL